MRWIGLIAALLAVACSETTPSEENPRAPLGKADNVGSCAAPSGDLCGGPSDGTCFCDEACTSYGDCCGDYAAICQAESLCRQTVAVHDSATGTQLYETWQDVDERGSLVREGGNAGPVITAPYQNFYDDLDRLVLVTSDWDGSGESDYRRELRYDDGGRITFETLEILDFQSGQVVETRRRQTSYDGEGNPVAVSDEASGEDITYERSYAGMEEPGVATLTRELRAGKLEKEVEVLYDHGTFGETFKTVSTHHVDAGSTFIHEYHRGGHGFPYRLINIYHYWPQNSTGTPDLVKRFTYNGGQLSEVLYDYADQGNSFHGKVLSFAFAPDGNLATVEDLQEQRRLSVSYASCSPEQIAELAPDPVEYVTGGF